MKRLAALLIILLIIGAGVWLFRRPNGTTRRYENITPQYVEANDRGDSTYHFTDTLEGRWSAEVDGRDVALRSLVLRDVEPSYRRSTDHEWEVALKGGVAPQSRWVGVGVSRSVGPLRLTLDGGYDGVQQQPYVGASASLILWRDR